MGEEGRQRETEGGKNLVGVGVRGVNGGGKFGSM